MHILNNGHDYGNLEHTLQLFQPYEKGKLELLGVFIYIDVTSFIDRRTEDQRL